MIRRYLSYRVRSLGGRLMDIGLAKWGSYIHRRGTRLYWTWR